MLCKANQYLCAISEEKQQGRANQTNAPAPTICGVIFLLLHHTSLHVSALARHPFTCVPQEAITWHNWLSKELEVSTSGDTIELFSHLIAFSSRLQEEVLHLIARQTAQWEGRLYDEAPLKGRCTDPCQHIQTPSTSLLTREMKVKIQTETRSSTHCKVSKG